MAKAYNRYINTYINNKEAGVSIKQIQQDYAKLNNTIKKNLIPNTKEYNEAVAKLRSMKSVLTEHTQQVNGMTGMWKKISTEVKQFGLLALGALGAQQLVSGINNLIKRNADLSDSFADVAKTTGLTSEAVQDLYKDLGKLNTRTSRKELLDLARDAGKLGITGQKNILEFVRAADKINVALGEDLGKDAITSLGKLAQQFKTVEKFGFEKSLEKIGSAINDLGANSAAQEQYIVDFTTRLAGVSKQANFTIEDTLGLASTLDNLGLQSETSSTALSQTIVAMFKDTAAFAKIAGLNTKDFADILNKDANDALLLVLKGLKGNSEGLSTMSKKLDELGIDGARSVSVLASLAENTQLLEEQQKLANASFEKGTSLMNEFNVKNETLGAKLERVQRALSGAFINSGVVDAIEAMVTAADDFINVPLSEKLEEERIELNVLVMSIQAVNTDQKRRNELIKELQEKYPDFIGNIAAEKVSNELLQNALEKVNKELLKKIIIQKSEEKIRAALDEQAEKQMALFEQEEDVLKVVLKAQEKLGFQTNINATATERAAEAVKKLREISKEDFQLSGRAFEATNQLKIINREVDNYFDGLKSIQGEVEEQDALVQELNKEHAALVKKLGMEADATENINYQVAQLAGTSKGFLDDVSSPENEDIFKEVGESAKKATKSVVELQQAISGQLPTSDPSLTPAGSGTTFPQGEGLSGDRNDRGGLLPSLDQERIDEIKGKAEQVISIYSTLSDTIFSITSARYENERMLLDEAMAAEIRKVEQSKMNEEQKQSAISRINEKYARKQDELDKKQMRARKAQMITMAIASGAQAILSTIAAVPGPLDIATFGGARIAMIAATAALTAAQVGVIAKQKFATGGPTGPALGKRDSTGHYPVGIVHDNEYVAAKAVYTDPQYAPIFDILETAHKAKGLRGFAMGGETSKGNRSVNLAGITPPNAGMDFAKLEGLLTVIARNTAQPSTLVDDNGIEVIKRRMTDLENFKSKSATR